ncbi:MAG TPA: hypothetical protein VMF06_09240, partial [Candidatus Limnocylindria bacterium]|nr:hypothetical protein [Candidatus Limnocylindria bacterium]
MPRARTAIDAGAASQGRWRRPMRVHTFIADTAFEAVERIRAELGPGAVVLNVRQLPADGLSRLWKRPRIEVLATVPEGEAQPAITPDPEPLPK